jgi:two-component system copper resistance phosphate regulon response regulator CusR
MTDQAQILVVDDDAPIRALVTKILERAGHVVDNARDGEEAIEKLDRGSYAVLVIDLMMPKVDGYGVIAHLRQQQKRPAIIVITAGDSAAIRRLDGGMVHSVVRKPFEIDVLADLVSAAAKLSDEQARPEGAKNVFPFRRDGTA